MKKINEILKPKKITITGKSKILCTENGKCVIKEKNKDVKSLYDYLNTRQFNNYPEIIDEINNKYVYEYLDSVNIPNNQKSADMADLLALLHNKTAYFKPITTDYIKNIYEEIQNNIRFIEEYYAEHFEKIASEVIMSPSNYLLIRNSSKLLANFKYIKDELDNWYKLMTDKTKERVVYCHNNLTIDHYIKNKNEYLISWDNYSIDTPVLDLINLYSNDYNKYEFSNFLENYNQKFPLSNEELKLFFIMISLPKEANCSIYEFDNTRKVNEILTYLYKTEKLIKPYYSPQNIK
ncbi:MAG: hypothetical protein PHD03_03710 [Bacilli bacterium]|nr:hypothetical protein [Bacilli bacterium]MDD4406614.1 hypothetical protein [Bacilli bacterium]